MTISKDKMISLTYELRLDGKEGDVFETAGKDNPLVFLYGAGIMLPAFEAKIAGLTGGTDFNIEIPAKEAYGEVNEEAVVDLPKNIFEVEGKFDDELIKEGNTVPMMSTSGQRMNGIVLAVNDESIKMDFNHPLAGEDLHFKGDIIDVRDATAEELTAAQNVGGCDCSGGGCSDDGCDSSGCDSGGCC
jgi:FKBP-type peptidyl-prolyl cis-trans isomerase SlyD